MKTLLQVSKLNAFYGSSHVIFDVDLEVAPGQGVALIGRNGAGKSSTLKSIMGLVRKRGRVIFDNQDISESKTYQIARLGIGYVPEDRRIYPELTVQENILMGARARRSNLAISLEEIWSIFPLLSNLRKRQGRALSGGEQQLLTLARTLIGRPRLLLLDEPTEGLAPLLVQQIGEIIRMLRNTHKTAYLLAEQNLEFSLNHAEYVHVIESGHPVYQGSSLEFKERMDLQKRYLAV